jgi:hypothetical protein
VADALDARVLGQTLEQPVGHAQHASVHAVQAPTAAAEAANHVCVVRSVREFDDDVGLAGAGAGRAREQLFIELALRGIQGTLCLHRSLGGGCRGINDWGASECHD